MSSLREVVFFGMLGRQYLLLDTLDSDDQNRQGVSPLPIRSKELYPFHTFQLPQLGARI